MIYKNVQAIHHFILSVRSKDDIVKSNKTGVTVAPVPGIILAVAGIILMIVIC